MLLPESGIRVWLYAPPADMRKSFDGLSALVRQKLAGDPASGQLFVFLNRRRTQLKVLYFEPGGYCLWSKRLEAGRFHFNEQAGDRQALSWTDLSLMIEGIDLSSLRRFKRFEKGKNRSHERPEML
ncbi:IS66 family insertion sequence element accessory protein TnpB [Acidithiobacillus sp. CV18-2]|uniref:IS66 family insertion sequence element accessory protein TnpB n=2 Tax=Igneacidithiobacillus copahuensis TaxID=2724909 RepID=A0AAE2YQ11_9PROT|nr:IS66 family insertion sequence element accessory protein TnpB [Acidithiobacillus sp. CV18-3]MBU2758065.1 IS66 family insertion sequence element accessory protein TnpB [Acidithiobacillus sp. BN09-2]MBU2777956.1 IS66 family insertion sequence element accessory protein TnpB [Acidithiobacillus sp. CV18-2]MBU2788037.1 IS66 family insertion sequence element accessory protein TnpB [Igneacidithiobacillus copahuensis]MBU2797800.1 IS66 family insertion sequence element accessory protein TnpB [Acidithi